MNALTPEQARARHRELFATEPAPLPGEAPEDFAGRLGEWWDQHDAEIALLWGAAPDLGQWVDADGKPLVRRTRPRAAPPPRRAGGLDR